MLESILFVVGVSFIIAFISTISILMWAYPDKSSGLYLFYIMFDVIMIATWIGAMIHGDTVTLTLVSCALFASVFSRFKDMNS